MEVALVMMDVNNNVPEFGESVPEAGETGQEIGERGLPFGETSTFGNSEILADFFDDWSFFELEDDDDTSQEARSNNKHPVRKGMYCEMCTWDKDGMNWSHDDDEPMEIRYMTPGQKEKNDLLKEKLQKITDMLIDEIKRSCMEES